MFRKIAVSAIALAAGLSAAQAADLGVKGPVYKAPVANVLDWSGFYVGVHGGVASGQYRDNYDDAGDFGRGDFAKAGALLGGQVGYNRMYGRTLYGIELDASWAGIRSSIIDNEGDTRQFKTNFLASARLRTGVAVDNWLLFSTIGVAYAQSKFTLIGTGGDTPSPASVSLNSVGFVSGLGAEYAFAPNWSVRGEYLFYRFNKRRDIPALTNDSDATDFVKLDNIHVFRVAANYRFNGMAPVRPAAPTTDWRGFYVGAHAGYGRSRMPGIYDEAGDNGSLDIDPRGFLGGAQFGHNWQSGSWVYGLELDGTWSGMNKSRIDDEGDTQKLKLSTLASFRGRIGGVSGDKLFYLTGGVGYARSSFTLIGTGGDTPSPAKVSLSAWAPVIGAGTEWAFAPGWNARLESLTYFFNKRVNMPALTNDSDAEDYIRQSTVSVVRLGVNYRFNSPVVAKY